MAWSRARSIARFEGWKKLVYPDDWPSVKLAIERANASGDVDAEYRVVQKDGAVHWLHAKGRMFFDAEGRPSAWSAS